MRGLVTTPIILSKTTIKHKLAFGLLYDFTAAYYPLFPPVIYIYYQCPASNRSRFISGFASLSFLFIVLDRDMLC